VSRVPTAEYGGDLYTGADAEAAFTQLQAQIGANGDDGGDKKKGAKKNTDSEKTKTTSSDERKEDKKIQDFVIRFNQAIATAISPFDPITGSSGDEESSTVNDEDEEITPSIWDLDASAQGLEAEKQLSGNLPYGLPVIDEFVDNEITSIKSMDLTSKSYTEGNGLLNTLKGYVNKLVAFKSGQRGGVSIEPENYTAKFLKVAIQLDKASSTQFDQIGQAMTYAQSKNVNIIIVYVH
jgi:hypothetical protein